MRTLLASSMSRPFSLWRYALLAVLVPLTPFTSLNEAAGGANALHIEQVWQSTWDASKWFSNVTDAYGKTTFKSPEQRNSSFANVFPAPQQRLQPILGFGAGTTDATSVTLLNVKATNETRYWEMMNLLFDVSPKAIEMGGAGLNIIRSPLGASDFSLAEYTFDDTFDGSPDTNLTLFSIKHEPKLFEVLRDIKSIDPEVKLFFAPWSQPAWMKENALDGRLHGGTIQPRYYETYAEYIVKAMKAIQKEGLRPYRLSLQNEPLYQPATYPGTYVSPDVEAQLGTLVRAALDKAGLHHIKLLAYDHNWDQPQYPVTVFNETEPGTFAGAAWHCYAGDPSAQEPFNLAYPEAEVHFTECTRITQSFNEPWQYLKTNFQQLLSGSLNYSSESIILWNAILQSNADGFTSPHLPNVCTNCLAPLLVRPDLGDGTSYIRTSDFILLAHGSLASRPLRSGLNRNSSEHVSQTHRMGVTVTDGRIVVQAFEERNATEEGECRYSLVMLNQNDHYGTGVFENVVRNQNDDDGTGAFENVTVSINFRDEIADLDLPVGVTTLWWYASPEAPSSSSSSSSSFSTPVFSPSYSSSSANWGPTGHQTDGTYGHFGSVYKAGGENEDGGNGGDGGDEDLFFYHAEQTVFVPPHGRQLGVF